MSDLVLIKTVYIREHDQDRIRVRGWFEEGGESLDYTHIVRVRPDAEEHAQAVWEFFDFREFEYGVKSTGHKFVGVRDGKSDRAWIWVNTDGPTITTLFA